MMMVVVVVMMMMMIMIMIMMMMINNALFEAIHCTNREPVPSTCIPICQP
jgi:hypothetical protein